MATLQVRDLPDDVYEKLNERAKHEHRSLAQETIVILREALNIPNGNKERRKAALGRIRELGLSFDPATMQSPVDIIREGRER